MNLEKPIYSCRFHPTDSWHEVGCPHMSWTKEQLQEALDTIKLSTKNNNTTDTKQLNINIGDFLIACADDERISQKGAKAILQHAIKYLGVVENQPLQSVTPKTNLEDLKKKFAEEYGTPRDVSGDYDWVDELSEHNEEIFNWFTPHLATDEHDEKLLRSYLDTIHEDDEGLYAYIGNHYPVSEFITSQRGERK